MIEGRNTSLVLSYLMKVLYLVDKAFSLREDLIAEVWKDKKYVTVIMFKERHNITKDEELDEWVEDAKSYISNIRNKARTELNEMSDEELRRIMNDFEYTDKFISKYKMSEEDLQNDRFFQCDKHIYRCVNREG